MVFWFSLILVIIWFLLQFYIVKEFKNWTNKKLWITGWDLLKKLTIQYWFQDVTINPIDGTLTDHFMPSKKQINLSKDVYFWDWVSSIAVALHEFWHLLQHKEKSTLSLLHSYLFPFINISSFWSIILFMIWLLISSSKLILLWIIIFSITTIYYLLLSFLELDASKRWYKIFLDEFHWVDNESKYLFRKMLFIAFLTYFLSLLQSILQLVEMILKYKDISR